MLKYALVENLLTERPNEYSAQVYASKTFDKKKFIERLLQKGTLMTETDAVAAMNAIESTVIEIIEEGGTLNLPLFNTSFTVSGIFEGPIDTFDGKRHKLNIKFTKGILLREVEKRIMMEKTVAAVPQPTILEVRDSLSGKVNEILTPNGVIEVRGVNIKIAGEDPDCGLWFTNESGKEEKAAVFIENKPSVVIAAIPALATGAYQLKIVTRYTSSGGRILKNTKTCIYHKILIV